ncbi:anoctamin-3-like [Rhynchophorus ferrugineus]|uniref:anoctamin-3-like n=1 Tax=Rhynchophorus ferrugineus TaxID=354439 RepID=UPI003FCEE122
MNPPKKRKSATMDETKRIDYVLVVRDENLEKIQLYLSNLNTLGLETEVVQGETVPVNFVKIIISNSALKHFSEVYDVGNEEINEGMSIYTEPIYTNPFKTPLSDTMPKTNKEITDAERIVIVNMVLESTKYGAKDQEYGLTKLINRHIVDCAYPLHDGPASYNMVNTRSLLLRFWANFGYIHKEQPLDTIYRYFGHEIAFYFAWLEYFNLMLIPPSILGVLCFFVSIFYAFFVENFEIQEMCNSHHVILCPTCEEQAQCKYKKLSSYCSLSTWTVIFDNYFTLAFAVFMSFWAILFRTLWKRKENKLKLRWTTNIEDLDTEIRPVFEDRAVHTKRNKITGEIEPYTPRLVRICRYSITIIACAFMLFIICLAMLTIVILQIMFARYCDSSNNYYLLVNSKWMTMVMGSTLQVIFIKLFSKISAPLSIKLTNMENPRTQQDFDKSVLYKRYLFSFCNNYIPLFYLAFVKGKMYSVPHASNFLNRDVCTPANCVVPLCIQLSFLLTLKALVGNICSLIYPYILKFLKRLFRVKEKVAKVIPQWEEEYGLFESSRYLLTTEFTEMIIKYGLVTFFVSAFPLTPLCALANNVLEARSDAYKLVALYRRPLPLRQAGIGAWNGVILSVTYLSTATNAFVIAFTSDIVPREVYKANTHGNSLNGFVRSTLTRYGTKDYSKYANLHERRDHCYFRGHYNPTGHPQQYDLNRTYWTELTFRFIAVMIFEHFILVCNAILSYSISKYSTSVKEHLNVTRQELRKARLTAFQTGIDQYDDKKKEEIKTSIKLHVE